MTVTGITEVSKSRSRIEIDHQFAFVLYKGELRQYHVREGEELQEADYCTIMEEVLPKRAKLRCMNLLKSREYTTEQLKTKLRQGQYPEEIIDQALDYVASFHYIDDLRYAKTYVRYHQQKKSRQRLKMDLLQKGVAKDTIEHALEEEFASDERDKIRALLEKRRYDYRTKDAKEQQRMYQFLLRRGYKSSDILGVMRCASGFDE